MNIIPYREEYKKHFIQFNTDWIEDNFGYLEDEDLDTFHHIDDNLKKGAMIYFAVENGNVLATCMAKPLGDDGLWELCKLGSNKNLPHKGGRQLRFQSSNGLGNHTRSKKIIYFIEQ